jgi:hypothetical protein
MLIIALILFIFTFLGYLFNSSDQFAQYSVERGACRQDGNIKKGRWVRKKNTDPGRCRQQCDRDSKCTGISYRRYPKGQYSCYLMYSPNNKGVRRGKWGKNVWCENKTDSKIERVDPKLCGIKYDCVWGQPAIIPAKPLN